MAYENIVLIIAAIICVLVYILDKDPEGYDPNNYLLRYIFLILGISFLYMALVFNINVSQANSAITTINSITTYVNTSYNYTNSVTNIGQLVAGYDLVYTVAYVLIMIIIVTRMLFGMIAPLDNPYKGGKK